MPRLPLLLLLPLLPLSLLAAAEPAPAAPAAPAPTVNVSDLWLYQHWSADDDGRLTHAEGNLHLTLRVAPAAGWRVVGQPRIVLRAASAADGRPLRRINDTPDDETLDPEPARTATLVLAPPVGLSGLAEVAGTVELRLAADAPKEAVFKPLSAWIGRSATLAGEAGTEVRFVRDDDGQVRIAFNAEAAARFAGLTLRGANGAEVAVDGDNDSSDGDLREVSRALPDPLPEGATLALRFAVAPRKLSVPFRFAPLVLPGPPTATAPETVPLAEPQAVEAVQAVPADNRF